MNTERIIHLMRVYHYATGLPIRLTLDGGTLYALPQSIVSAADISNDAALSPLPSKAERGVQYLTTPARELFLFLYLSDASCLLGVGPFLQTRMDDAQLAQLIRRNILPFGRKKPLGEYYAARPVLSEQQSFYSGRLLEMLFLPPASEPALIETPSLPAAPVEDAYYAQTYDYRSQQFLHAPYAIEQEICRAISNGDTAASKHILTEINRMPRAKLANTGLRSLKNSLICSCTFMARAAIAGGVSPDEAFTLSDAYIQCIEQCATTNDLSCFEAEMIEGYTARVLAVRSTLYSNAVIEVMRYIDNHLSEPIRIEEIAAAVYHNPNYLSCLFKKETGETLHAYILRKRIEESRYFVRHTQNAFAEIAAFYQFCSQSHFVQCFRRITGMTPGEYRRKAFLSDAVPSLIK